MERSTMPGAREGVPSSSTSIAPRVSGPPRSTRVPGMGMGHEVLLALIMAVAMAATVLLHR